MKINPAYDRVLIDCRVVSSCLSRQIISELLVFSSPVIPGFVRLQTYEKQIVCHQFAYRFDGILLRFVPSHQYQCIRTPKGRRISFGLGHRDQSLGDYFYSSAII